MTKSFIVCVIFCIYLAVLANLAAKSNSI
uniref:Uncharacterized protein n=1 Tax=Rhizophora mucronata TaxID=61149 RepID=A0A2P2PYM1_RHIMU